MSGARRCGRMPHGSRNVLSACIVLAGLAASPAWSAKWVNGCPKVYERLSRAGKGFAGAPYVTSPYFEHVGHTLTFRLKDTDVRRYGGFSTDPDGNTVEITFTPLGEGDPIPLPPFPVTAVSPSTLSFVVPDTTPLLGRLVVGPAHIIVKRGATMLFDAYRQVILPPMNDIHALASQGAAVEVLGTMDRTQRLWIPLGFGGFGQGETLPECPAELTPITAFAIDFSLKKGDGQAIPHASFGNLKNNKLFFGDYVIFGTNLYGAKLSTKLDLNPLSGRGVVLCARNDALQLVLMIPLKNSADGPSSDILPIVRDGSPLVVKLEEISADPEVASLLPGLTQDSLKLPCYPTP